ncbi:DinB family protein [Georgenia alba]|uniref:DinB family protein n=1 Tax=Georgenia alba TaxID=2233858 RepID=A0ABW2QB18_9MICO
MTASNAVAEILARADAFAGVLEDAAGKPEEGLASGRWTSVEYGGHVRDMLLVQRDRVLLARREDVPEAAPMGRDERVAWGEYDGLDPVETARQVRQTAGWLAGTLGRMTPGEWRRRLVYNYPARAERTLEWLAANVVHELVHHELDVRQNLGTDGSAR